jgi:hypothetical protein
LSEVVVRVHILDSLEVVALGLFLSAAPQLLFHLALNT